MRRAANLVLQSTTERIYTENTYCDIPIPHHVYIVRGENVLLLGEIVLFPPFPPPR